MLQAFCLRRVQCSSWDFLLTCPMCYSMWHAEPRGFASPEKKSKSGDIDDLHGCCGDYDKGRGLTCVKQPQRETGSLVSGETETEWSRVRQEVFLTPLKTHLVSPKFASVCSPCMLQSKFLTIFLIEHNVYQKKKQVSKDTKNKNFMCLCVASQNIRERALLNLHENIRTDGITAEDHSACSEGTDDSWTLRENIQFKQRFLHAPLMWTHIIRIHGNLALIICGT